MATADDTLRNLSPAQRADFVLSSISSAGALAEEKATEFIRIAQNSTPLMKACRVEPMKAPTKKLPKILFSGVVLRSDPGDGSALASGQRVAPTTSEISLVAKKFSAEVKLGYDLLEDNVEADSIESTVLTLLAEKVGIDLEAIALAGDTSIVDATQVAQGFAQADGWLKRITTNVVSAGGAALGATLLSTARASVPLRFRTGGGHQFFVGEHAGDHWRQSVAARATTAGDAALTSPDLPLVGGTRIIQCSNLPVTTGSPDTAPAIYTNPKNLILGVWKRISVKVVDRPEEGGIRIFLRTRVAFAVEHEAAAAKITGVRETPSIAA